MKCPKCGEEFKATIDGIKKAPDGSIVPQDAGWFAFDRNPFGHGCCDCGLFHQVEFAIIDQELNVLELPEGAMLALRFTRDQGETERLREAKELAAAFRANSLDRYSFYCSVCKENRKFTPSTGDGQGGFMCARHLDEAKK